MKGEQSGGRALVVHEGVVIRESRGAYEVETEQGIVTCAIRSKLRKCLIYPESRSRRPSVERVTHTETMTPVVVGDRVRIERAPDGTGVIEAVLPRRTKLSRPDPGRLAREQVIIANADQLLAVFAVKEPDPHVRLLDRLLIAAEAGDLTPVICFNKMDLLGPGSDSPDIAVCYARIGYRVIRTSALSGQGVDELGDALRDRLSALAGPSGVGKTSLLNRLQPGLGLKIQEISQSTGKGRHTTSQLALHKLDQGGMVIDTPGLRAFGLWEVTQDKLPTFFPEMRPYLGHCKFARNCSHVHEPGCAIKEAVASGAIATERYESYVKLWREL